VLALSLIEHREKRAGLSKASLLSVASCQHCCARCHMESPSHGVAQHIQVQCSLTPSICQAKSYQNLWKEYPA